MSTITIKIIGRGEGLGTLGHLIKNAAAIRLGPCDPNYPGDQRRGAWLLDRKGSVITYLVDNIGQSVQHDWEHEHNWTAAARAALGELIEIAEKLLDDEDSDAERPVFALAQAATPPHLAVVPTPAA